MSSKAALKTSWGWEEWQQSREARRAVAIRIGRAVVHQKAGSSDSRLSRTSEDRCRPDRGRANDPSGNQAV